MKHYIETKVKYSKTMEDGLQKTVTEPYLVDAMSFTEAEQRITDEITPYMSGDFSVSAVKKSNISEVFWSDAGDDDKWFKVKVNFVTLNEKTMQEKRSASYILVQACGIHAALKHFDERMKGTVSDYEVAAVAETAIVEVYEAKYHTADE